jgi:hypothetical protein
MVYRSVDGGDTLQMVGSFTNELGAIANLTVDAVGHFYSSANPEVTFYSSSDMGDTWQRQGNWLSSSSISALSAHGTTQGCQKYLIFDRDTKFCRKVKILFLIIVTLIHELSSKLDLNFHLLFLRCLSMVKCEQSTETFTTSYTAN